MERGKLIQHSATHAPAAASSTPAPALLCLSLHESDKIRVMNLAATSIPALRSCIESNWSYGIQSEGLYGISYQFKLQGRPWQGSGEQANAARRLMAGIFGFLLQAGWVLKVCTDLNKWMWDKDTFYFKQEAAPDPLVQVCAISFNMSDKIRVIGGPTEVVNVVRRCVVDFWHRGLQREQLYYGSPEFKLHGSPWTPSGKETMQSRMFVGQMIEGLDRAGWEIYASIDISQGKGGGDSAIDDVDSWILRTKADRSVSLGTPAQASEPQVSYKW